MLPLLTAGDGKAAESQFLSWLWYASRRDEISLERRVRPASARGRGRGFEQFSTTFEVDTEDIETIAGECEIETFGQGRSSCGRGRSRTASPASSLGS